MLTKDLSQFKKELEREGIILTLCGPITHDVIISIGDVMRNKIENDVEDRILSRNVFSIFVEQLQNIINYSEEREHTASGEISFGIVVIGQEDGNFFLISGNKISRSKQQKLDEYLSYLNSLSKEELKQLYKEKRRQKKEEGSDSKGGGIGFIEMARKAKDKIEYSFSPIDEEYVFFSTKIII